MAVKNKGGFIMAYDEEWNGMKTFAWAERREKNPHTCDTCTEYSHTSGECGRDGDPKSPEDSCSDWD